MYKVITSPVVEPVLRADIKNKIKFDLTTNDDMIDALITSARLMLERECNSSFITQTVEMALTDFPEFVYLEMSPVQSITSVTYLNSAGTSATLTENTDFVLDTHSFPHRLVLKNAKTWPSTCGQLNNIKIRYVAGYGDAPGEVPAPIRTAIEILVSDMHENPTDAVRERNTISSRLVMPYNFNRYES